MERVLRLERMVAGGYPKEGGAEDGRSKPDGMGDGDGDGGDATNTVVKVTFDRSVIHG